MSDLPSKTYPPSFLQAVIADHEAEQAGATTEDSSAVQAKGDAMKTLCLHALRTRLRRRHYDRGIDSLCYTLLRLHQENATPATLRYHVVDWLDAMLAMEIAEGGRDE